MKGLKHYALAALLILSALAFANQVDDMRNTYAGILGGRLTHWDGVAMAAVMICFLLAALVYMFGKAIGSDPLVRYAKTELLQVAASSLIIFFIVELLFTLSTGSGFDFMVKVIGADSYIPCGAAPLGKFYIWSDNGEFGAGPIGAFKCKLQEKISGLEGAYGEVEKGNKWRERFTSTCFMLFSVPVYCGDWSMSMHKKVEEAHLLATKITSLLISLHAQYVLASYVEKNMLAVFLPLGILLRIFPLTRGAGGLFISMALGFFFIWPTFYLLTDPTFVHVDEPETPSLDRQPGMCFNGFKGTAIILSQAIGGDDGAAASEGFASVENAKLLVYQLDVATQFYPFVSLVVTLAFMKFMTPLFGGDMGDFTRMVSRLG